MRYVIKLSANDTAATGAKRVLTELHETVTLMHSRAIGKAPGARTAKESARVAGEISALCDVLALLALIRVE